MKHVVAVGVLVVAAVGLGIRLPQLEDRPLHTDESVHAIKFKGLWESGEYRYDPREYHGPSLYYLTWPIARASGAESFAGLSVSTLRLLPVFWGVGIILLLPLVGDGQGRWGTIWAGLFTAVSPAMVFYSRYYIHEMGLVFFTFLWLASGWRYYRTRRWRWALLGGLGLGLMAATKETFVLEMAAAAGAVPIAIRWGGEETGPAEAGAGKMKWAHLAAALGVALSVWVVLFTSFFSNAAGLIDSIRTYAPWFKRAEGASPHIHPWWYYLGLLAYQREGRGPTWSEGLILGLALVGIAVAWMRRWERGAGGVWIRFVAIYTLVLAAIYSFIPYKTPWCLLGFLHGLILLAGVGAAGLSGWVRRMPVRAAASILILVGAGQLTVQAYRASYTYADNPRNPYVYGHTLSDILDLVDRVEALAGLDARGHEMVIKVMANNGDYWPLPWYLRRFDHVGWWGGVAEDPVAPIVIASPGFAPDLEKVLGKTHQMAGYYGLRPGVLLQLYVDRGLWERYLASQTGRAKEL